MLIAASGRSGYGRLLHVIGAVLRCQSSLSLDRGKRKKKHSTFSILERDRREGDREVEYSAGRHLHSRTASQLTCKYWKPFVAMSCNPDTCTFIYPSLLRSTETFSREEQPERCEEFPSRHVAVHDVFMKTRNKITLESIQQHP